MAVLEDRLARIPALSATPRRVEQLSGGLTNLNLKVTTPDGVYVARVDNSDTALLGIDRDAEHANTRAAAEAGVGPPVADYRPDLGVLVVGFVDAVTYDDASFDDPAVVRRAAQAIRALHDGPPFTGEFDMFARQRRYRRLSADRGIALPATYDDHAEAFARLEAALTLRTEPGVPCNNDLLAANFLDDGERVWLIDYEYSGTGAASFELGNTSTECGLDDDQLAALVTAYLGRPSRSMVARVTVQTIVSQYGWSLWGYLQAATSPLDFDFAGWGDERFDGAVAGFARPDLDDLLTQTTHVD